MTNPYYNCISTNNAVPDLSFDVYMWAVCIFLTLPACIIKLFTLPVYTF